MKITFEEYLKTIHAKTYMGPDDYMSEDFDDWLSDLDGEEYMKYAEQLVALLQK